MPNSQFSTAEIQTFAHEYRLGPCDVEPIHGGNSNTSYLLRSANGRFVLTIFQNRPKQFVERYARLIRWLTDHHYPTSRLCLTQHGEPLLIRRGKPILVKRFIVGQAHHTLSHAMLRQVGTQLEQLHRLPSPPWLATMHPFELQFPVVRQSQRDRLFSEWVTTQIARGGNVSAELPCGLIHGDLFWDNLLFDEGQLRAVIDFELAHHGSFVFDLAMAIIGTCIQNDAIDWGRASVLVSSYEQARQLLPVERDALQRLISYAAAITACWRFWRYQIDLAHENHPPRHYGLMVVADQVQQMPAALFAQAIWAE